jgi:hypothetical protein
MILINTIDLISTNHLSYAFLLYNEKSQVGKLFS